MENQRYMRDGIDLKRMFLLFKKKVWLVIAAVVAGAVLGGGVYLLYHLVLAPEREYQSVSKIYLNFDCEPEDYNQLAYNGYTWNDLMVTDPILNYTMEALPSEVARDTVIASTKAEILSDIRLLTITITAGEPELVAQIMEATQKALVHLGETDELFHSIEVYSTTQPQQIVWDNRTVRAVVTGAVIALFAVIMVLAFYYVLDDSVYVASDAEKRYGIPVLGIFTEQKPGAEQKYGNEFLANYRYKSREMQTVSIVSADDTDDAKAAGKIMKQLVKEEKPTLCVCGMPEEDAAVYSQMRKSQGVILAVKYGCRNGKRVERMLSNLEKQDCKVFGMVIVNADASFLKMYYMGKKIDR